MIVKFAMAVLLAASVTVFAQSDNQSPKQDAKDAASSTGKAAKKTGHKVAHGTKKVVNKGAHETKKGAGKVEGKTEPTPSATPK